MNRTAFLGASAVSLLILSACGGATSSNSNGPVNLGLLAPLTGSRAATGQGMVDGATLAVDDINAHGGVLGHHVNLVVQDDAADPVDAVSAANKLINVDHVVAIIGPTSLTAAAVLPIAERAKIPLLMQGGGSAFDQITSPYFYRLSPSDSVESDALVEFALSKGWKTAALAFTTDNASQALIPTITPVAQQLGLNIVANVSIAPAQSSYRSEISKIYANHPDVVISQLDDATSGTLFAEVRSQGLLNTAPWIGSDLWYSSDWYKAVTPAVAGSGQIFIMSSSSYGLTGGDHFLQLLQAKYNTNVPPHASEPEYDGAIAWALGADQAGSLNMPDVRTGILKVNGTNENGTAVTTYGDGYNLIKQNKAADFEGAASTVDFDKYDNVYGPFSVLQYDSTGNTSVVANLTAQQIQSGLK